MSTFNNHLLLKVIGGVFGILLLITILGSFRIVGAGERGIVLNWGAFNGEVLDPGLHWKVPFKQKIRNINVQAQVLEIEKSESYSKDLQPVDIHSVVNYNIKPETVGEFFLQYRGEFENVLAPRLETAIKQTIASYTAEELLNKRAEVQTEIEKLFKTSIPPMVNVVSYSLTNEAFSDAFENAIEKKQVAQQDAERSENELKKVKVEAEQRVAQAEAEARAIRLQSDAANNPNYVQLKALEVQLKAIEKWDGKTPSHMIPGASVPFINLSQ